ncbi:hypothetical protein SL003B_0875 [Polymorphum gilvum SL003B-26A1]|uniref:Uncharacterized protein n=1 Tax=Polymorphum gilvum (strain LMG 25793 / CGMCC 1.9160 / SL003B-26A1) TaxID=991905 RepID=F2IX13_POLGS|nr:hypothetical protein SL003B_0875 [Polymorphum gilvum SL003B-26A1]
MQATLLPACDVARRETSPDGLLDLSVSPDYLRRKSVERVGPRGHGAVGPMRAISDMPGLRAMVRLELAHAARGTPAPAAS